MNSVNVDDLILDVRRLADMENSEFVTDSEIVRYLDDAYKKMFRAIVNQNEDYFIKSTVITTSNGTKDYSIPSDFYKLRGCDVNTAGSTFTVSKLQFSERNDFLNSGQPQKYLIYGSTLSFYPTPSGAYNITLWYSPVPTALVVGGTFDDINGFSQFIKHDAAVQCMLKEQNDASLLIRERDVLYSTLLNDTKNRDESEPFKIVDLDGYVASYEHYGIT